MLNDYSNRTKAIRAALELAETQGWRELTLAAIAQKANLNLAELRAEFDRKSDILAAFQQEVDRAVLGKTVDAGEEQSPRDRLLEVVMTRFEVMAPYRPALKRILADVSCHPAQAGQLLPAALASQYWMLAGAGIPVSGALGGLKLGGLAAVYSQVLRHWLDDETPGFEKTMALLDRKLARGEQVLSGLKSACGRLARVACCCAPRRSARTDRGEPSSPEAAAEMGHA